MNDNEKKVIGENLLKRVLRLYGEAVKTSELELKQGFPKTEREWLESLWADVCKILAAANEDRVIAEEVLSLDKDEYIIPMRKITENIAGIANDLRNKINSH